MSKHRSELVGKLGIAPIGVHKMQISLPETTSPRLRRQPERTCGRFLPTAVSAPRHADSSLVVAIATPARANRQSGRGQKWRPCSGDKEDFIRVGALDLSSWGKSAHVNVAGVGRVRAGHEPGLSGDRRSIRDVSRRSCRGHRRLRRGTRAASCGGGPRAPELVSEWAAHRRTGSASIGSLVAEPIGPGAREALLSLPL